MTAHSAVLSADEALTSTFVLLSRDPWVLGSLLLSVPSYFLKDQLSIWKYF